MTKSRLGSLFLSFLIATLAGMSTFSQQTNNVAQAVAPPPFDQPPAQNAFGSYICPTVNEGLLTAVIQFTIAENGRFTDQTTGQKSAWRYTGQREFTFPQLPDIERAIFIPGQEQFRLFISTDSARPHGRGQQLICSKLPAQTRQTNQRQAQQLQPQTLSTASATERIAFASERNGSNQELFLINPNGTDPIQLTNSLPYDSHTPTWSPDGSQIIFEQQGDLYKIDADGKNLTQLTDNPTVETNPAWSPNGQKVAYTALIDGTSQLVIMSADGSNATQITNGTQNNYAPSWSANSQQLVFHATNGANDEIYLINEDGTNQQPLTNNIAADTEPAWSPDNKQILFVSTRNGTADLYKMSSDGSNVTQITFGKDIRAPSWSPDGTQIVFAATQANNSEIYVANSDGSEQIPISNEVTADLTPVWIAQDVYIQRVLHIAYDPYLSQRQTKLSSYYIDPLVLVHEPAISFKQHSDERVKFVIQEEILVDAFPPRSDGFQFDETTFFECWDANWPNTSQCNGKTMADYNDIINDATYDICGRLNRGEIDEVWLSTPRNTGFYESVLAGPAGFPFNGPTFTANSCNSLIPIMTFNYERAWDGGHTYGHRMEATMTRVYGSWQQNSRSPHNWEKFGMVRWQSPDFDYAGCGSVHYPPNSTQEEDDYDYGTVTIPFDSICDDFDQYPNLSEPEQVKTAVTCSDWNCDEHGYYYWWYSHLPTAPGFGADGKRSDWWPYFLNPNLTQASPLADFSMDQQFGSPPLTVNFTNESLGSYDTLTWNFGNGDVTSETTPSRIFPEEGFYPVTLTLTGPFGSDSITYYVSTLLPPTEPGLVARYYDYDEGSPPTDPFGSGTLQFERVDSQIDFHWANTSPDSARLGNDRFAVQWTGWVRAPFPGEVTFRIHSDDGSKIQVGHKSNNTWLICGACYNYLTLEMEGNKWYPIVVEYFENDGAAQIQLEWQLPGSSTYTVIADTYLFAQQVTLPGLWGTYYAYSGPFYIVPEAPFAAENWAFARQDSVVDFNWGESSPDEGLLGNDHFAVHWDGWVRSPVSGNVRFRVHSDDGTRLQVGHATNEAWVICGNCNNYLDVVMEEGTWLPIRLEYFEDHGAAQVQLDWQLPGQTIFTAVPQAHLVGGTDACQTINQPLLTAVFDGSSLELDLTNANGTNQFYVYKTATPYETPFMYSYKVIGNQFSRAAGAENAYYYITEANGLVCESVPSKQIGLFHFALTPGGS